MTDLLEAKLQPPHLRPGAVERVRLLDRLGRDGVPRLVLVSAPPGFGKSTLVAQWVATVGGAAVAWVSLDPADGDPARFWRYVAEAVERAVPGAGANARDQLGDGGGGVDQAVRALVNDLAGVLGPGGPELLLVLDDLHAVEGREVADGLAFLLEHLPPRAHIVAVTRADPPLPIARLRARGELAELRAADLRFTRGEAAAYLNDRMGLSLGDADVDTLEARTEGWIAALQLAAISMRDRDDPAAFVAAFAGDDRYLVDYLADEVLERQPDAVRAFLLETSILERLTGPLCDAVTAGDGGAGMLEALDRANLFLVPLDDRRRWYRYHHLFADLLRARLLDARAGDVPALHARASRWWEAQGEPGEAVRHAIAAGDVERTADLVELAAHELRRTRQEATLRAWLDGLPDEVFARRPVLAIAHAGAVLSTGESRGVEARLAAAERWAAASAGEAAREAAEADGMIVRHPSAVAHLPGAIALYRAALARMTGDGAAAIAQARIALDAAGEDQPLERGAAAGILGLATWSDGDLDGAHATWTRSVADLERAGHRADMLGGHLAMGEIRLAQGRLADARATFERGLRVGMESSPPLRGTADMHVGLAELALDRHELVAAGSHLEEAERLGEAGGLPQNAWRLRVGLAGLRAAEGDLGAAHALLDEAERVFAADFFPAIRPIAAIRARLWLREGRHADALAWADATGRAGAPPSYLHEFTDVTVARAVLAAALADGDRAATDDAGALVERLLAAATAGGRTRSVIELTAMAAIARAGAGDRAGAAAAVGRALALAEPEGVVRPFVELGSPVAPLVRDAAKRGGPVAAFAQRVAGALDGGGAGSGGIASPVPQPLVEPLSERELEVLRLLASDLDGPAIASALFVSLNTLRTHTKNIFAKLGVNSRRAAVTRGIELGLLRRG